jgi:hypothetical protein
VSVDTLPMRMVSPVTPTSVAPPLSTLAAPPFAELDALVEPPVASVAGADPLAELEAAPGPATSVAASGVVPVVDRGMLDTCRVDTRAPHEASTTAAVTAATVRRTPSPPEPRSSRRG